MKKIPSILFLLLLLINGVGFYVFYILQLYQIKAEMRVALKTLPDDRLDIFKLTEEQYQESIVEEGEIKVDGKMYDVARVSHMNGFVKVYCLHDEKEDNLFALLDEIVSKPIKSKDSIPQSVFEFIGLIFIEPTAFLNFSIAESESGKHSTYHFSSKTIFSESSTPPPRLISSPITA